MSAATEFFLLQASLIAVVLVLHTYLGLHIIRRTLIFSDLVLDQLAAFGVLVGIALGVRHGAAGSYALALVAVLAGAFLLTALRPRTARIPREAVIGVLYALALVASLLAGDKIACGTDHVTKTLTGSMLWATWPLVAVTAAVYAALAAVHFVWRRRIIALVGRRERAPGDGGWEFLFFATQGVVTVLIVPVAGVLLAYAFLMIPAGIAALFRRDWGGATLLGWSVGTGACLAGLAVSYLAGLPYGPTLVLALGAAFAVALLLHMATGRREEGG
ncbi:MAG: metal ABC transporter permease [Planctomycetes bacterium]|nr:metal ABC transporter permease [Planctomycetota bacterium]